MQNLFSTNGKIKGRIIMPCLNWIRTITSAMVSNPYGSKLEAYIISKNPKSLADVEAYAIEYERKLINEHLKFYGDTK